LLELLGEANGPLISENEAELQVLTQISTDENYGKMLQRKRRSRTIDEVGSLKSYLTKK
jgi:hypothetical protein